jgi:hypothetical protein
MARQQRNYETGKLSKVEKFKIRIIKIPEMSGPKTNEPLLFHHYKNNLWPRLSACQQIH